jgi:catechol 2,3-dioxygenase-like lactoylglutathione lyase family enzyme
VNGFAASGRRVATVSVVVADYDEAIAWYVDKLGFVLTEDVDLGGGKRWVTVEPGGGQGARLLLAKADGDRQTAAIGNQTGGRVFLFLETDDFARDHALMLAKGVEFRERHASRGLWHGCGFRRSLHGNLWDLIEPKR